MGNLSKRYLTLSYWARGSDKKREVSFGRAMVNAVNGDIHTSWILEGFHGERVVTHFSEINIKNGKKKKV